MFLGQTADWYKNYVARFSKQERHRLGLGVFLLAQNNSYEDKMHLATYDFNLRDIKEPLIAAIKQQRDTYVREQEQAALAAQQAAQRAEQQRQQAAETARQQAALAEQQRQAAAQKALQEAAIRAQQEEASRRQQELEDTLRAAGLKIKEESKLREQQRLDAVAEAQRVAVQREYEKQQAALRAQGLALQEEQKRQQMALGTQQSLIQREQERQQETRYAGALSVAEQMWSDKARQAQVEKDKKEQANLALQQQANLEMQRKAELRRLEAERLKYEQEVKQFQANLEVVTAFAPEEIFSTAEGVFIAQGKMPDQARALATQVVAGEIKMPQNVLAELQRGSQVIQAGMDIGPIAIFGGAALIGIALFLGRPQERKRR